MEICFEERCPEYCQAFPEQIHNVQIWRDWQPLSHGESRLIGPQSLEELQEFQSCATWSAERQSPCFAKRRWATGPGSLKWPNFWSPKSEFKVTFSSWQNDPLRGQSDSKVTFRVISRPKSHFWVPFARTSPQVTVHLLRGRPLSLSNSLMGSFGKGSLQILFFLSLYIYLSTYLPLFFVPQNSANFLHIFRTLPDAIDLFLQMSTEFPQNNCKKRPSLKTPWVNSGKLNTLCWLA